MSYLYCILVYTPSRVTRQRFIMAATKLLFSFLLATSIQGLHYDLSEIDYNLNTNQQATNPLEYSGVRKNHHYWPSPDNWRMPFYTLFLDRYANGDPSNDDINGTVYEQDLTSNQLRHGGDLQGLVDSLDYIHGMGVKVCSVPSVSIKTFGGSQKLNLRNIGDLHCWFPIH